MSIDGDIQPTSDQQATAKSADAADKKSDGAKPYVPEWSALKETPAASAPAKPARPLGPEHPKVKFFALALLIILSTGFGFAGGWLGNHDSGATTIQKQQVVLKSQGDLISTIATTMGASVVSVNTTTQMQSVFGFGGQQEGAGTGIILTSDGLIITNRHVVPAGTTSVSVTLSDGTEYDNVSVIGRTSQSDSLDVAFLKISDTKGKKLTPATLGDSSKMKVGDTVVAIGNALGQFQNTVTTGILSGYGRSVQASDSTGSSSENLEDLFQTDAAINEGNSGGPLVNLDGQVIGINTAIAGNAQSIGFAIPINDVSGLIKSVEASGKLERPYLGVQYVSLTNDLAKQYNLSATHGAYIPPSSALGSASIIAGGPADQAGVQEGDIITAINGQTIDQNHSLSSLVNKHAVGDKVTLTIMRGDKTMTLTATLSAAPTN
ncbi:MAG TPA: trypsin-like peptidase domain-containing protein [Candidatus Saccharimonadales bacterium]|nr:trypsin-like peptidase domain-containing protein [Candidatus Saccharimonadales bacterium]